MLNRSVLLATVLALGLGISTGTHAIPVVYTANLAGSNEIPGNASTGTGLATVTLDVAAHTLRVQVTFAGLSAPVTAAHIHCCLASPNAAANVGVATSTPTFTGFPSGVMSGSYDNTFDLFLASSWSAGFISANGGTPAGALNTFAAAVGMSATYFNIHTSAFPGGELRGTLVAPIPEPSTYALMLLGLAFVAVAAKRRQDAKAPKVGGSEL